MKKYDKFLKNFLISFLLLVSLIFFSGVVSAAAINDTFHINLQTTFSNGTIQTGTFAFAFNITESSSASCLGPFVYNHSTTQATDTRGIASIYLPTTGSGGGNLSLLSFDKQYYLCYYRDGTLKDVSQLSRVPYSFRATEINLSEIVIDSNLSLGNYNISGSGGFFSFLGSLANRISNIFLTDADISNNLTVGGNLSAGSGTFFVDSNGNKIGIGTTSPNQTLDIVGKIYASENFKWNDTNLSILIGTSTGDTITRVTGLGYGVGQFNTGVFLTAVGAYAGQSNSGVYLTAIGANTAISNTGGFVTAVGSNAASSNTGSEITALGYQAGWNNTANYLTAIGAYAGQQNIGNSIVAIGHGAGQQNIGNLSTFVGYNAGYQNNGSSVSSLGYQSGYQNTGNYSTGIGHQSLYNNSGNNVVAIGYQAGLNNLDNNIFILEQTTVTSTPLIWGNFSSGYVGIGTTLPQNTLNVNGTANVTGETYLLNSKCNAGEVLTADTSTGLLSCVTDQTLGGGAVTGGGNGGYIARWNGTSSINNSAIFQLGNTIGIGTITPQNTFNVVGDGNFTGNLYSNGAAVLTSYTETDPKWSANYSAFLNKVNWADVGNNTLVLNSQLNNGTYFRTNQWNSTNTTYNTAYLLTTNGTFVTSGQSEPNWNANYSDFLTTKSLTTNGTFYLASNPSSYTTLASIWTTLSNGTVVLYSTLNNGTYITNTILNNGSYVNTNLVNWANVNNGTISDVNKVSWLNVGNGTLQTVNATWTALGNGTMASWLQLGNGTMVTLATLNNGTYSNTDTFAANYSAFLNKVNWADVGNNTLILNSQLNNGTYFRTNQWNSTNTTYNTAYLLTTNGTFVTSGQSEPNWNANYSAFLTTQALTTNGTFYLASNPSSYTTANTIWAALSNGTVVLYSTLNNGTYANYPWNATNTSYLVKTGDTATGNYTFDTNTFFIDSTNHRVGIGITSPQNTLNVNGTANVTGATYLLNSKCNAGEVLTADTSTGLLSCVTDQTLGGGAVTGGGSSGYIARWNGTSTINNSAIFQLGNNIGVNTTTPQNIFNVVGDGNFTGNLYSNGAAVLTSYTETDPYWAANYSDFLTTKSLTTNGTFYLASNPSSYTTLASIWTTLSNGTVVLYSTLNNGTYITNTVLNNGSYVNTNLVNWANVNNGTISDVNKVSWLNVGNGTLQTVNATWTALGNGTMASWLQLGNGTMVTLATLNNGSYSNTDTFVANYSAFLNKVNWADVGNGTLVTANSIWTTLSNGTVVLYSTLNNGTYITNTILDNGTYANYPWNATNTSYYLESNPTGFFNNIANFTGNLTDARYCTYNATDSKIWCNSTTGITETDPKWSANYSDFLTTKSLTTNGTFYLASNPSSYTTLASIWTTLSNGTVVLYSTLNNGTYANYPWNATNTSYLVKTGDTATGNYTFDSGTFFVDSDNGRVGIGTTLPQNTLNVNGTANVTGATYLLNSKCNSGEVLTADTSTGLLSCVTDQTLGGGAVTGGGNTGYIARWNGTSTINNSAIFQLGNNIGVNTTTPQNIFNVVGDGNFTGNLYSNGAAVLTSYTETDPYWAANYSAFLNKVNWADVGNGTMASWLQLGNGTMVTLATLNNGTYSNTDTFVANYSAFLNHVSWANVNNGTISDVNKVSWLNVGNGTLQTVNATWTALGNGTMASWLQLGNGTMVTLATLNNGTYSNTDTFVANYSAFLNKVNWADVGNNTLILNSQLNNGTYFRTNQWNATNSSYNTAYLLTTNGTFVTSGQSEPNWNANYSDFLTTKSLTTNGTFYLASNPSSYTTLASIWTTLSNGTVVLYSTLNNGTYITNTILDNGSYVNTNLVNWANVNNGTISDVNKVSWLNVGNGTLQTVNATWTALGNGTMASWLQLGNGTMVTLATLNNGSYSNTDTFVANYSAFLNKVNWADVNNGTIFPTGKVSWADVGNNTLILNSQLNNGTYFRTNQWNSTNSSYNTAYLLTTNGTFVTSGQSEPNWNANYSDFLTTKSLTTNGTFYLASNPSSYTTANTIWAALSNGTVVLYSTLNNGSYSNTDTFVANYSAFLNKVNWADVGNNTLVLNSQLNNGTYFRTNQWNSTNTTYNTAYLLTTNGTFVTSGQSEPNWNANYSQFLTNTALVTNGTFYLASNPSSYTTANSIWTTLSNGTVALNNGTFVTWSGITNGTAEARWSANYSAFLNKVNWGDVNNGTIFPTGKVSWADVGNGTLVTANSIWTTLSNGTVVLYSTLNNGTYITNTILNNGTYANYPWNATNTSYYLASNPTGFFNNIANFTGNLTDARYCTYNATDSKIWCNSTTGITETDPYWAANYSDFLTTKSLTTNGTFYLASNPSSYTTASTIWAALSNGTVVLYSTLNNGSYSNTDTFVANYSAFLNKVNWADVGNNTLVLNSQLNNGTYFRTNQWNSTNTTYNTAYLLTTNGTFVTSGQSEPNWNANYSQFLTNTALVTNGTFYLASNPSSYTTANSIWTTLSNGTVALNNGTFVTWSGITNGTAEARWSANYSAFLNKVNWGDVNNGTIFPTGKVSWADVGNGTLVTANSIWTTLSNGTVVLYSTLNNGTYITNTILNNGTYANYPWNATNTSYYLASNPTGFFNNIANFTGNLTDARYCTYNATDSKIWCNSTTGITETDPYWAANYSDFLTTKSLTTNGTFYLASNPSSYTTMASIWTTLSNGTVVLYSTLNNGSYSNTDTFVANYSAFLNKVNWADVNNGTIFPTGKVSWSDVGNNTLILNSQLNNGTYFRTNQWNATNSSYNTAYLLTTNGTFVTSGNSEPNWNANYSAFLTTQALTTNGTFYLASNPSSYTTANTIWAALSNGTVVLYSTLNNGTYITNTILNNGSYVNTNLVNWADVGNGTLATANSIWAALSNGTMVAYTTLNNGSYFNYPWNATNTSYLVKTGDTATGNYTFDSGTFFVDSDNGRVGIGTTLPNQTLDVVGSILASSNIGIGTTDITPNLGFGAIEPTSRLTINGTNPSLVLGLAGNNTGGISSIDFISGFNSSSFSTATIRYNHTIDSGEDNRLEFDLGGVNSRIIFTSSGRIGIGTTTPQNALNVIGDINATGYFIGNGSQLTDVSGAETNWNANYSAFLTTQALTTNGTFYLASNPSSYTTANTIWAALSNGTVALNNGTFVTWSGITNGTAEARWSANYSAFLNKVNWADVGNGTLALNSTFSNYLPLSGGTMTGNLNISTFNITTQGSGAIYSNSTCIKLKGATSIIEIC